MKKILLIMTVFTFIFQTNFANEINKDKKDVELIYSEEVAKLLNFESNQIVFPLGITNETSLSKIVEIQMFNSQPDVYEMKYLTPNDEEIRVELIDLSTELKFSFIYDSNSHEIIKIFIDKI